MNDFHFNFRALFLFYYRCFGWWTNARFMFCQNLEIEFGDKKLDYAELAEKSYSSDETRNCENSCTHISWFLVLAINRESCIRILNIWIMVHFLILNRQGFCWWTIDLVLSLPNWAPQISRVSSIYLIVWQKI